MSNEKEQKINKWFFLFLPIGIFLTIAYIHNLKPAVLYWWFEATHPSVWLSLRYWFLGTIYSGCLFITFVAPFFISIKASVYLKTIKKPVYIKMLIATGFIIIMILCPLISGLIAGYIAPNYLQEFLQYYFNNV